VLLDSPKNSASTASKRALAVFGVTQIVVAVALAGICAQASAHTFGTVSIAFGSKYEPSVNQPETVTVWGL
jgi:hypothetical protein